MSDDRIAWHPAFVEALQAELEDYAAILEFHPEYPLNAEPLVMDVLVIKKVADVVIEKNIGAIFRKDNIVEYKSPEDYVSVADFHKVYGYAHFYISLQKIAEKDVTITFVERRHPQKLLKYLQETKGYTIEEPSAGIYRVEGDTIPIQIIESKRLAEDDNLWLEGLSNDLDFQKIDRIFSASKTKGKSARLGAYLNVILRANRERRQRW
jgi:hypothetical protein